ncbi:MAG: RNA pyrophosphohydrolase [Nitratireductor sp.]|nr:RNA pyrophosphohydrolase [Nitratireductor sp.]MCC0021937.1 RNA pyrophosphohydrolase [Nitratireductor sp.]
MGKKKISLEEMPYRPCVGIMVLNAENRVWAGHRISPEGGELSLSDQRWQMPQGGIDKGEEPLAAALRELWEETGMTSVSLIAEAPGWINYDLPAALIGRALKGRYRGQRMAWFAFRFEGDESEINIHEPPEGAPVEFDAWEWVEMNRLPELVVPFKRQVYDEVLAAFRHLG